MFSLESDEMTALWPNDSLTFAFYVIISNIIPNWATFVKEVFWFDVIHLCFFPLWIIFTSMQGDKNGVFYTRKYFLPKIFTPLSKCLTFCSMNIYLCASRLKWCFLHLKMFSTWIIYTTVCVFFNCFQWKILTFLLFD